MRLLIYTRVFSPMVGGMETITMVELARSLARSSHTSPEHPVQVTVVTPTAKVSAADRTLPFSIFRKPTFIKLVKLIWETDILHVAGTDMLPLWLGWLLRKRMVVEHHGFQTACPHGQMFDEPAQVPCPGHYMAGRHLQCLKCNLVNGASHSLKRWLLTFRRRWLCARADANVMPTAWLGSILQLPRMVTIHHGLSTSRTTLAARTGDLPKIVFLGRLVNTKGVRVLLQAVHRLRQYKFEVDIIGDGPNASG
jgi:glycosyltransferase involved in cell wall biosynthesis